MINQSEICLSSNINTKKLEILSQKTDFSNNDTLAEIFQLLSDETRLKILQALAFEELCVCEISIIADISQSAASHQMRRLRDAKLVKKRREGKRVFYRLYDNHVHDFLKEVFSHFEHLP